MKDLLISYKVLRIFEFIKRAGFDYETDEIFEIGLQKILSSRYGIFVSLSDDEYIMLQDELMYLAEQNEIDEGQVKAKEIHPIESGKEFVRHNSKDVHEKVSVYPVFYSYPVNVALKGIGPSFPKL